MKIPTEKKNGIMIILMNLQVGIFLFLHCIVVSIVCTMEFTYFNELHENNISKY